MGWQDERGKRREMKDFSQRLKSYLPGLSDGHVRTAAGIWMASAHHVTAEEWILAVFLRGAPVTQAYMARFKMVGGDVGLQQTAWRRLGERYGVRDFSKAFPPYQMVVEWEQSGTPPEDFVTEVFGFGPPVAEFGASFYTTGQ